MSAFLDNQKVTWTRSGSSYNGEFTTPTSKRMSMIWFLARLECSSGSVLRIESEIFIRGMGFDEERSRVVEFQVDEDVEPVDFEIRKVGDPKFPLATGPLVLLNSRCKLDDRRDAVERLIQESQGQAILDTGSQNDMTQNQTHQDDVDDQDLLLR